MCQNHWTRKGVGIWGTAQLSDNLFHSTTFPEYDTSSKPPWRGCSKTSFTNTENRDLNHPSVKFQPENICCTPPLWQSGWRAPYTKISIRKENLPSSFYQVVIYSMYCCSYINVKVHEKYLVSPVSTHQDCHFNRLGRTQEPNLTIILD